MIGSFWNLCRACPSMPVDKLHSEYRSTYRWHEYTGPRQEVVRRPPLASSGGNTSKLQHTKSADEEPTDGGNAGTQSEPALPRRKKHPELAYKTHEFLAMAEAGGSDDSLDSAVPLDRARSEERGGSRPRPSRRSKSEGPPTGSSGCCPGPGFGATTGPGPVQSEYRLQYMRVDSPPPQGRTVRSDSDPCEGEIDQEMVEKSDEIKKDIPRSRKEYLIRHHLERTTGATDGALLPSPTREKLEPAIPRSKDEDHPKSPQKASPKSSPRSARSQSVGPGISGENRSPKRQSRTPVPVAAVHKGQMNGPVQVERRPRPTSGPSSGKPVAPAVPQPRPRVTARPQPRTSLDEEEKQEDESEELVKPASESEEGKEDFEHEVEPAVVKSPPEPTRVKSPEQIIIRSPEPVNWTVPLDTGKTFTVTQNVREGELMNRPHSEVKAWTPPAIPPPAPQSAPPELPEHTQLSSGWRSPLSDSEPDGTASVTGPPACISAAEEKCTDQPKVPVTSSPTQFETTVTGTTLKCLEDPSFAFDGMSSSWREQAGKSEPEKEQQLEQETSKGVIPSTGEVEHVKSQATEKNKSDVILPDTSNQETRQNVLEGTSTPDAPTQREFSEIESPVQESQAKVLPVVSPSSGRSLASDVLEKARTRFDKFWGKGKDSPDKEGKV